MSFLSPGVRVAWRLSWRIILDRSMAGVPAARVTSGRRVTETIPWVYLTIARMTA
jgi:hypothetical protein